MNNFEEQQAWLTAEVSPKNATAYFEDLKFYLISIERLISSAIGINPLEFAKLLEKKLEKIKKHLDKKNQEHIEIYQKKLKKFKELLETHIDEATQIAEEIESVHAESIKKENIQKFLETAFYESENNIISKLFDKALSSYTKILEFISNKYRKEQELCSLRSFPNKYQDNMLAKVFLEDAEFLACIEQYGYPHGEIGHLFLQKVFFINNSQYSTMRHKVLSKKRFELFLDLHINDFVKYYPEAFKLEIIKLALYKKLSTKNSPTAWLGSSKTLMHLLLSPKTKEEEIPGIYLNCAEEKWTPELNRAWLIALFYMGYEVNLVEQQFPNVKEALFSASESNVINFTLALLKEIRKIQPISEGEADSKANDSQYNGGDSPTATYLEVLLLLSIGCTPRRNEEGNIVLYSRSPILNTSSTPDRKQTTSYSETPSRFASHSAPVTPSDTDRRPTSNSFSTGGCSSQEYRAGTPYANSVRKALMYSPESPRTVTTESTTKASYGNESGTDLSNEFQKCAV